MNRKNQVSVGRVSTIRVLSALIVGVVISLVAAGCGGDSAEVTTTAAAGTPLAHGQQLAGQSCSSCHGQNLEGVKSLDPALTEDDFIQDHTDDELIDFIKEGRSKDAQDSVTGLAMPPYGGNPRLTDDDLADIVLFLRTLQ
jgi:mono/diheme cytochrome c family protein